MNSTTDNRRAWTVSGLTAEIKALLEDGFPSVTVRGEISNLRRQPSGHMYFSLKDDKASLSGVCFRGDAARLSVRLRDGLQIVGQGRLAVYEPRGVYQVIFRRIEEDGIGRLQQAFLELKQRLEAEGLFAEERKQPLPRLAKTVGFVTSPSGAALRDFLSILERREWNGRVIVIPARVQGTEAAPEIVAGIEAANRHQLCDLLVVGRGGGSLEDLWPFNEERVARAVAASEIPVISAVGHQTDVTLSDFAADFRAETPSAAAEWIAADWHQFSDRWENLHRRLRDGTAAALERKRHRFALLQSRLRAQHPRNRLDQGRLRLDDLQGRFAQALLTRLRESRTRLNHLHERFRSLRPERQLAEHRRHLEQIRLRLHNSSHQATLQRGYALVRPVDEDRAILDSAADIARRDAVLLEMRDGRVKVSPESPKR